METSVIVAGPHDEIDATMSRVVQDLNTELNSLPTLADTDYTAELWTLYRDIACALVCGDLDDAGDLLRQALAVGEADDAQWVAITAGRWAR
jgi:hypothetical protein